jgi:hypothetical protein
VFCLEEGIIKLDSSLNVCIMFILQCVWLFCGFCCGGGGFGLGELVFQLTTLTKNKPNILINRTTVSMEISYNCIRLVMIFWVCYGLLFQIWLLF